MELHNEHCSILGSDQTTAFVKLADGRMVELPKPRIDVYLSDRAETRHLITMPQWLAREKGLI